MQTNTIQGLKQTIYGSVYVVFIFSLYKMYIHVHILKTKCSYNNL